MTVSRRDFLLGLSAGVAASATLQGSTNALAWGAGVEPQRAPQPDGPILLNSNENAYGPTEKVLTAMRASVSRAHRYPNQSIETLTNTLAEYHQAKVGQILLGSGSLEVLRVAAQAILGPEKRLVMAQPTYEVLSFYARTAGAEVISVPLTRRYEHDLTAMLGKVHPSKTTLVYLCNPNNPTATLTPRKQIENFIEKLPPNAYAVIDEAYHHFAEPSAYYSSFVDHPVDHPRVIVTRTFSKIYGLAGLRVGYGFAAPDLVRKMKEFLAPFNVNEVAAESAIAALEDQSSLPAAIQRNADDRQEFINEATGRRLKPLPCHANFAMMNTEVPARGVIDHFKSHNILIGRLFPPMDTFVRISFGPPQEMLEFWRVWDLLGIHPQGHAH